MIGTFNEETILVFGYAQGDDKKALIVEHTSKLVREDEAWATVTCISNPVKKKTGSFRYTKASF